jgi:hypothetical protein
MNLHVRLRLWTIPEKQTLIDATAYLLLFFSTTDAAAQQRTHQPAT